MDKTPKTDAYKDKGKPLPLMQAAAVRVNVIMHEERWCVQLVQVIGDKFSEVRLSPSAVVDQVIPSLREACAVAIENNKLLAARPMNGVHKQ